MTITTVQEAIQAKNRTITGIQNAPDKFLAVLNTADMPIMFAWPDASNNMTEGYGWSFQQRTWRLACYVLPTEQGEGISEGWSTTMTIMQAVIDYWLDKDNTELLTGTYEAYIQQGLSRPITDGGLQVLAYPPPATGTEGWPHYFGFELRMTVNEKWAQT